MERLHREFTAHTLELAGFPDESPVEDAPGAHIMGSTVHAWLGGVAIELFGEAWFRGGSMSMRYRRHLASGDRLLLEGEPTARAGSSPTAWRFDVRNDAGAVVCDGSIAGVDEPPFDPDSVQAITALESPAPPTDEGLDGLAIGTLAYRFSLQVDQDFVRYLAPTDPFHHLACAHPAWTAKCVNHLLRHTIGFTNRRWTHAGTAVWSLAPIGDGTDVRLSGRVSRLWERNGNHFGEVDLTARVEGAPCQALRTTIVYG